MADTKMKVGITGASGNIGTTLRKGLAAAYDLVLFDVNELRGAEGGRFVKLDCSEKSSIDGLFNGLDAVIHLAGDPRPNAPRQSTMRNNFEGTSNVFEEARKAGVKNIVFASSNFYHEADIGLALSKPSLPRITLDQPPTPQCLYGESKVFGESVGRHLAYHGMAFVALRIGWTVPGDDPARYDGAYMRGVYCSHRDLIAAFDKALQVKTGFLAAFAVSNNSHGVFDLTETRQKLGFIPQDGMA
ncbi:MAG: NAD(P)-dependent oxidoreductase [Candidatus Riflebacteria bacterium]|nr:NAD(P)-dependent oxidoreductase [Candidatus Riflebacteria bacterium]